MLLECTKDSTTWRGVFLDVSEEVRKNIARVEVNMIPECPVFTLMKCKYMFVCFSSRGNDSF